MLRIIHTGISRRLSTRYKPLALCIASRVTKTKEGNLRSNLARLESQFHTSIINNITKQDLNSYNVKATSMRTHTCGQVGSCLIGEVVEVCGWTQSIRSISSGLSFIKLRDIDGTVQIVLDKQTLSKDNGQIWEVLRDLPVESVVKIKGVVKKQPGGKKKGDETNFDHSLVEIVASDVTVLNTARNLPFNLHTKEKLPKEEKRLEFRHLDLRRKELQNNIKTRSKVMFIVRKYLESRGFYDIETPILFKPTPEGAREFLVPSRNLPGHCYSLPQSPQQFKQMLMVSGFDRYYQIARCFRDEDLRADRQPEFTQIDLEMSFIDQKDIQRIVEGLLKALWKEILDIDIQVPINRMTFDDAINKYGSDKPDLRLSNLEIKQLGKIEYLVVKGAKNFNLNAIQEIIRESINNNESKCTRIYKINKESNELLDITHPGIDGQIILENENVIRKEISSRDLVVVSERDPELTAATTTLGRVRSYIGGLTLTDTKKFEFVWIEKFPLFTIEGKGEKTVSSTHHPFTAPENVEELASKEMKEIVGQHYDIVVNGVELGGGSIRNHDKDVQKHIFEGMLNLDPESCARFNHLLMALEHGCPPHGGIALGFDRLIAILTNASSLRDVIAFPKSKEGKDLFLNSPAPVSDKELEQYHLKHSTN